MSIKGIMNLQKYKNLLEKRLEAELRKVEDNGLVVFQQDLAKDLQISFV